MNLSANSLFHITPKLEFLKSMLQSGFHPRYCIEEVGFFTPFTGTSEMLGQPMVCFCDIPLGSIKEHISKYGNFGIGMTKEWGVQKGISPVTYVYPHSSTADLIRLITLRSLVLLEEKHDDFLGLTQILKNYFKSIKGHMYKNGTFGSEEYNFYNEREWRYVPYGEIEKAHLADNRVKTFLLKSDFDDIGKRDMHNGLMSQYCGLTFKHTDINYLFVQNESESDDLVDFIETEYLLGKPKIETQRLISKIYNLDRLLVDL